MRGIWTDERAPWQRALSALKPRARALLEAIPLLPVRVQLPVTPDRSIQFLWSRLAPEIDVTREGLRYRGPERRDLVFLARYLRCGMNVFDVGAYHGLYAVVAGRCVGRRGRVTLFEPSAGARRRARLNLALNGVAASIAGTAVTDREGTASYYRVTRGYETMSGLRAHPDAAEVQELEVQCVTLDGHLQSHRTRRVDLIKLDVEGGELDVIAGAQRILREQRPLILCEVLDWVTRPWSYPARLIIERLHSIGYRWFDVNEDGRLSVHEPREDYTEIRNYVAVPSERVAELTDKLAACADTSAAARRRPTAR